jgi:DNA helicase-2/ATP-dependent DNA helicase PcrA
MPPEGVDGEVSTTTKDVIESVAASFADFCVTNQTIPLSQLVSAAVATVQRSGSALTRPPRYLFVDEFQDTDGLQMDLILGLRRQVGCRLFVVGDAKQGIYRFRGAEGNAFEELRRRVASIGLPPLDDYQLTRNFRSGKRLLDSLHHYFDAWGRSNFLSYDSLTGSGTT